MEKEQITPTQIQLFDGKKGKVRAKKRSKRKHPASTEEQLDMFLSLKQPALI